MSDPIPPFVLWLAGAGAVVLFVVDLVLSSALVAVTALGRVGLHRLAGEARASERFLAEMDQPSSPYRVAALIWRQLSLLGGCALAGATVSWVGWPLPWLLALLLGALLGVLMLETLAARALALRHPKVVLKAAAPWLRGAHAAALPVARPLARWAEKVRREVPNGEDEGEEDPDAEAEALIEVAEREGLLEEDEGRMMRGIVDLGDTRVREIMTPRTDILALPAEVPVREALRLLRRANHTRLPVYRKSIDDIVGVLHVRDLVRAWDEGKEEDPITAYTRPAFFVPEILSLGDLLGEMRTRTHIALAVDEYGGIAGLVTLEDLLEEIVGDIRDEHDLDEALVLKQSDGSFLVSGSAHVKELETFLDLEIEEERDFDTVGGLVVSNLGRVPAQGESLRIGRTEIEIVQADRRRVYRVRIHRLPKQRAGP